MARGGGVLKLGHDHSRFQMRCCLFAIDRMIFFERKGFCGEKEFIFQRVKSPQKIYNLLKNDAMARHVAPDRAIF
jgi:hypothetical protein